MYTKAELNKILTLSKGNVVKYSVNLIGDLKATFIAEMPSMEVDYIVANAKSVKECDFKPADLDAFRDFNAYYRTRFMAEEYDCTVRMYQSYSDGDILTVNTKYDFLVDNCTLKAENNHSLILAVDGMNMRQVWLMPYRDDKLKGDIKDVVNMIK